jgi:hypothetical protein
MKKLMSLQYYQFHPVRQDVPAVLAGKPDRKRFARHQTAGLFKWKGVADA